MLWPELGPGILEAPRNPAGSNFEPGGFKQVLEGLRRSAGRHLSQMARNVSWKLSHTISREACWKYLGVRWPEIGEVCEQEVC